MSRSKTFWAGIFYVAFALLGTPQAAGAAKGYQNPEAQQQGKFTGAMKEMTDGVTTAGVWTVKAPYLVGKYVVTEIFRPFVPIRDKLIDMFGVEVRE